MSMKKHFPIFAIILLVLQVVICNYVYLGPYIYISLLPAVILFLPLESNRISDMLIAFALGIAVDWLADGVLGLNVAALLPIGFFRRPLLAAFIGNDTINRKEEISIKKNGFAKIYTPLMIVNALFLLIYIVLDVAGARSFGFIAARFSASLGVSALIAPLLAYTLSEDTRR